MRKQFLLITLFFLSYSNGVFAQCNGRYLTDLFGVDTITRQYGSNTRYDNSNQNLMMDIYLPKNDTVKNRPCILFCFGGSFISGARISPELVYYANYFAKKGYVCASIDYRIDEQIHMFVGGEKAMFQAVVRAVQDGKAAIRYFNKMKDTFHIDSNQIFIGGTSAGGILAMNLAYIDSEDVMSSNWKTWANELGGFEGNSGNPGYPVKLRGLFTFAGGIGDTSFLNPKDYPIYMCHAKDDQTVLSGYGKPLNGIAPINLYGSRLVKTAMDRMNIYSVYDEFSGGAHPPFLNGATYNQAVLDTTTVHLQQFLYNVLPCNPNLVYTPNPQSKTKLSSIFKNAESQVLFYPNPVIDQITISTENTIDELVILNQMGQKLMHVKEVADKQIIDCNTLSRGLYIVQLFTKEGKVSRLLLKE